MNINLFKDSVILIAGGSGSWGQELTRQLLPMSPKRIIIYSRGEISQIAMMRKFNNEKVKYVIGDVRDCKAIKEVMANRVDYVFHLAALKHIPTCENYPYEAIQTNILGTVNIIEACIKYKIRKFIDVSTDKAVDPINLYGLTKTIGEKLTIQANCMTKNTEFICIRSGNVLGTNGSVVPYIINQIKTTNVAKIMDERMTRFFISFPTAIRLLLFAAQRGIGGETYVINMPSFYIKDLVELLVENYGNKDTGIEIQGIREGEKIHEVLMSEHELARTHYVSDDYYVIFPQIKTGREYKARNDHLIKQLSSANSLRDKEYLKELLKEGGWLNDTMQKR